MSVTTEQEATDGKGCNAPSEEPPTPKPHSANQLEGLERLSRLTTDLANERTLLAWVRTCLAAIRTTFAYLTLTADSAGWKASITATELAMSTLVLASAATGAWRYFKIKDVIMLKIPPAAFGRFTMRPLVALLLVTAVSTAVGIYSQQWIHVGHDHV